MSGGKRKGGNDGRGRIGDSGRPGLCRTVWQRRRPYRCFESGRRDDWGLVCQAEGGGLCGRLDVWGGDHVRRLDGGGRRCGDGCFGFCRPGGDGVWCSECQVCGGHAGSRRGSRIFAIGGNACLGLPFVECRPRECGVSWGRPPGRCVGCSSSAIGGEVFGSGQANTGDRRRGTTRDDNGEGDASQQAERAGRSICCRFDE